MKKIIFILIIYLSLLFPVFGQSENIQLDQANINSLIETSENSLSSTTIQGEYIRDFSSEIVINKDGTINIKEKILYDFLDKQKHGIYRIIPMIKTNQDGKKYQLDFSQISVTDEKNNLYQYKISKEDD